MRTLRVPAPGYAMRLGPVVAACLLGLGSSRCGRGTPPAAPPADAGGGSGGGGAGTPDAGASEPDGGSASADAGTPPDAGTGGGVAECAGVVPTLPGPGVEVTSTHGTFGVCLDRSVSDGNGTVLLGVQEQFDNGNDVWLGFDTSGTRVGAASSTPMDQPLPFPLESGFQWFTGGQACSQSGTCTISADLRQLSSSLTETSRTNLHTYRFTPTDPRPTEVMWSASADVGSGTLVTHVHKTLSPAAWAVRAQRFDAAGTPLGDEVTVASGAADVPQRVASGVSTGHLSLVLWKLDAAVVFGRWLEAAGTSVTPVFEVATGVSPAPELVVARLVDDSLALRVDGNWTTRLRAGVGTADPAPDWLATRPDTTLSIVRGGTAYLLTFPSTNCESVHGAFFAASGARCGGLDFPARSCAHAAESGYDGTVMVSGYDASTDRCTRTYWPGLLR